MKQDQKRYLVTRLAQINNGHGTYNYWKNHRVNLPKPPRVIAAEKRIKVDSKIVARYTSKCDKAGERIKEKKKAMSDHCQRLILSDDFKAALRALDRFHKMKFN